MIYTVRQLCEKYPWPTYHALRSLCRRHKKNGFGVCMIKVGRRVLINEAKFLDWLAQHLVAKTPIQQELKLSAAIDTLMSIAERKAARKAMADKLGK